MPDGSNETLIHITRWDLNWQGVYRYGQPVSLPKGTVISMRYTYDNSQDNYANPNHPPKRVTAGNRSVDEMAHLWLQVLPHQSSSGAEDPRMTLQEALARHHIQKNPGNFEAHYNLAAMLQSQGKLEEAIAQYEAALRLRPDDPIVNNAFGAALLAAGNAGKAIQFFQAALRVRPDYFDSHYNLGNALALEGEFAAAADEFSAAVRLNANDAGAEVSLGNALAELGRFSEAKTHYQRALQINPENALARENLQQLSEPK